MRVVALVVVLLATCVLADNVPNSGLKNETAPGKYHDRYNNHRHRERHHYRPPLIDQFVCDLDATILVVASTPAKEEEKPSSSYGQPSGGNSYGAPPSGYGSSQNYQSGGNSYGAPPSGGYQQAGGYNGGQGSYGGNDNSYGSQSGGYGEKKEGSYVQKSVPNAVRLKCSHIAIRSEHDCNSCCELAARRDHSVSRKDIFGFIVDASELVNSESGLTRYKRSAPPAPAPYSNNAPPAAPASYSGSAPPSPAPPAPYSGNAPPSAPPAPYSGNAPSYQAPAPQPGYQQPPAAPPSSGYQGESPAPPPPSSNYEQGGDYSGGSSQSSYSSGGYSTDVYTGPLQYPIPPKNARCVCCAPKGYEHRHREHRRRHHDRRRYDSEESDEYY